MTKAYKILKTLTRDLLYYVNGVKWQVLLLFANQQFLKQLLKYLYAVTTLEKL